MNFKEFYRNFLKISEPYQHQEQTWDLVDKLKFPLLIKAPTGSGKTEAVVAPFLNQFINKNFKISPRLIYVLPMRVLVNSITGRIESYAKNISSHISVKIQHGDIANAPFFIGDIVVTTLDQFLYGFARASHQVGRHIDMPAGAIASSLVVFDEAHMYRDGFTFSIMRALMEILHHSGIPFITMTATMPDSLRESLFENINLSSENIIEAKDFSLENKISISFNNEPLYTKDGLSVDNRLLKEIKSKKTLIIFNQVKRAQGVYDELKNRLNLKEGKEIVLLHSRFTKEDRRNHESEALNRMSHKEDGRITIPKGIGIVVSTQVLEAGIDFSAELLLTELAPADSLIQRAGRCARYENEAGKIIIFPIEEDKKNYLPYEKGHLEHTWDWLQNNKNFNIKSFKETCDFVNILDYKANDYEARDTLIDIYECVLYADTQPRNIQLRDGKPATLVVVEPKVGEKKKEKIEDQILNGLKAINIREKSFDVDIKTVWGLFKQKLIKWELIWKYDSSKKKREMKPESIVEGRKEPDEEDQRIGPFRTYILESSNYDQEKGVMKDEGIFI